MVPTADQIRGFFGVNAGDSIGHNIAHATIEEGLENMIANLDANRALNADGLIGAIARTLAVTNPTAYTLVFNIIGQVLALKLRRRNPLLAASISIGLEAAGPGIRRSLEAAARQRRPQDRELSEASLTEILSGWRGHIISEFRARQTQADAPRQTFVLMAPEWMLRAHSSLKEACRTQIAYDDTEAERRDQPAPGAPRGFQGLRGRAAQILRGLVHMERETPSELMRAYEACAIARMHRQMDVIHRLVTHAPQVECRVAINQAMNARAMPIQQGLDLLDESVDKEAAKRSLRGAWNFVRNFATGTGRTGLETVWWLFAGLHVTWLGGMALSLLIFGGVCLTGLYHVFLTDPGNYNAEFVLVLVLFIVGLVPHTISQFSAPVAGDILNAVLKIVHGINPLQGAGAAGRWVADMAREAGLPIPEATGDNEAAKVTIYHQNNRRFNMIPLGVIATFFLWYTFANAEIMPMAAKVISFIMLLVGLIMAWFLLSYVSMQDEALNRGTTYIDKMKRGGVKWILAPAPILLIVVGFSTLGAGGLYGLALANDVIDDDTVETSAQTPNEDSDARKRAQEYLKKRGK